MTSRTTTIALAIALVTTSAGASASQARDPSSTAPLAGEPTRPNIVLILADDLGWRDLALSGHAYHETPHLDALARSGLCFENGYSSSPNCAPTRASLMTGQWTPRHGIYTVGSSKRGKAWNRALVPVENTTTLADEHVTLAETLREAGYATAQIGKWHLGDDPRTQGFDFSLAGTKAGHPKTYLSPYKNHALPDGPEGEYLTDRLTDEALGFIDTVTQGADSPAPRPFFLYLPTFAVHTPVQGPVELRARWEERLSEWGYTDKELKRRVHYAGMIERLDQCVGRLLHGLQQRGLRENTLVVFTSDNGGHANYSDTLPLRGSKGTPHEGGIRVPLIFAWPGHVTPATRTRVPATTLDLFPTFLAAAGIEPGKVLDGADLSPLFAGSAAPPPALDERVLFWHFPAYLQAYLERQGSWRATPNSVLRAGRWKLLELFEAEPDDPARFELYDLWTDPGETTNLATERPAILAELSSQLADWREQVDAPVPTEREPDYQGE